MKICSKCHAAGIGDQERYCPQCGSRDLVVDPLNTIGATHEKGVPSMADRPRRFGAFLIDLALLLLLSGLTTLLGPVAAVFAFLYQLFRDAGGASIGKRLLGMKVVSKTGRPATATQWILRNVVFVLPTIALVVPALGFLAESGLELLIAGIELVLLLVTGSRLGDRIAGTTVVRTR
jgi:uncharacterized RDD family membrane protein YckC